MTVPAATTVRTTPAPADGVNVDWDFPFKFSDRDHIHLFVLDIDNVETEISSGLFSVSPPGQGGSVTYPLGALDPIASPNKIVIARDVPYSQPNRIGNQGAFLPQTHEDTFDLLEMQLQQIGARLSRTFYVREYPLLGITDYVLPDPVPGYALVWGAHGLVNSDTSIGSITALVASAEASAELTLGYAALAVNALQTMVDAAVIVANGGSFDSAALITYAGDWASLNVADALDEAKAASVATDADVTALQSAVTTLQGQVATLLAAGRTVPVGAMLPYMGGTVPTGFVLMIGQTVGKAGSGADLAGAGYAALFDVLGDCEPNDGTEVFADGDTRVIPDASGCAIIGRDNMSGAPRLRVKATGVGASTITGALRGEFGGVDRHQLTEDEGAKHSHPFRIGPAGIDTSDAVGGLLLGTGGSNVASYEGAPSTVFGHQIGGTGDDKAHTNMQPSLVADWMICTGV